MAEETLEQGIPRIDVAVGDGAEIFRNAVGWKVDQIYIIVQTMEKQGLSAVLKPIPDASHMRNRVRSPPNSQCFPGTRQEVMKKIRSWMDRSLLWNHPHIFWVYGYAGCGKSAIAQAICEYYAGKGRLAASFFFFRGAGPRSRAARFATTLASQVAAAIPATIPFIEVAIKANSALLTSDTSLSSQIEHLVYRPIDSVKWDRLAAALRHGPFLIALNGVDECEDHSEISEFIEFTIQFFDERPRIPIRFLVTSRVESHIHQRLHTSKQVKLLDLVNHTSDQDISAALDAAIEKEKKKRLLACDPSWPSPTDRRMLIQHIGGSYIFMVTIIKLLFDPQSKDGLTPMDRLPLVLATSPDFDGLYRTILTPSKSVPHFHDVLHTIALVQESLSISQIANLLDLRTLDVVSVLLNLHAIVQVPGDDHSPVTLWHTSLRDFLTSRTRAGPFFANPRHHIWMANAAIRLASSSPPLHLPMFPTSFVLGHLMCWAESSTSDEDQCGENVTILSLLERLHNGCSALEIACQAKEWKLVCALVNVGANIDTRFQGSEKGVRVALHAACHYGAKEMVYFLLEKGADPNIVVAGLIWPDWGRYAFPLAWAAAEGDVDLVNQLLACGADPNLKGGWYGSALHACAWEGKDGVARILLEGGADPNTQNEYGNTPLHYVSICGHVGVEGCLLEFQANPNLKSDDGWTPLHCACLCGHLEAVEYLLDYNADPSIRDDRGKTGLQLAQGRGRQDVVVMLTQRGITE